MKRSLTIAALALSMVGASAAQSRAQTFFTPFAGVTFANDAPSEQLTLGASLTMMGDVAGFELDFGYTPDFFNTAGDTVIVGDNNVTTVMGNLLIGVGSGPVRPYLVGGVGLLRSSVDGGDLFDDLNTNDFGLDAGGGIIAMIGDRVGLRGDVRYFRTFDDPSDDGDFDLSLGPFDFWRATGGVAFRF